MNRSGVLATSDSLFNLSNWVDFNQQYLNTMSLYFQSHQQTYGHFRRFLAPMSTDSDLTLMLFVANREGGTSYMTPFRGHILPIAKCIINGRQIFLITTWYIRRLSVHILPSFAYYSSHSIVSCRLLLYKIGLLSASSIPRICLSAD